VRGPVREGHAHRWNVFLKLKWAGDWDRASACSGSGGQQSYVETGRGEVKWGERCCD
jgi:hypothetical protein